ncbi:unnamed protein product [Rhizopus stolonifer]
MWIDSNIQPISNLEKPSKDQDASVDKDFQIYSEEDDATTENGKTIASFTALDHHTSSFPSEMQESFIPFENSMTDLENSKISKYQNTYFMDGGNRFISLPTLGNTSTKSASHISRIFEDWLQHKLYYQGYDQRLPILEDSVELLAEDIINKLKSRNSVKGLTGLARIFMKIRTGHVYTYHSMEDGQPLITEDMSDFFQQFPLFIEIVIYTMPREDQSTDDVQLLLNIENITLNSSEPYRIRQDIQLIS